MRDGGLTALPVGGSGFEVARSRWRMVNRPLNSDY